MSIYENLKTFIQENIKSNGQGEITGQVLQDVLLSMTDSLERNAIIVRGDVDSSGILEGEYEGYKNRAISQTSMAIGAATTAGLKGWYYSAIDFSNKRITLSDKPTYTLVGTTLIGGDWTSGTPNINVGDVISLVNDSKYDLCSKVTGVNGNIITVNVLPFTELTIDEGAAAAVLAGQFSDGYSVYIPERPDSGIIDFGGGAFSEGGQSKSTNICSHAEGLQTHAYGQYSHAEGRETKAGYAAHAEGRKNISSGDQSHTEGADNVASHSNAHAEGHFTKASGYCSHAEGLGLSAGNPNESSGGASHVEGYNTKARGVYSHAEGSGTIVEASAQAGHAEGKSTVVSGHGAHAEGDSNSAGGLASHAEGFWSIAMGDASHAEGNYTKAIGHSAHAEGKGESIDNPNLASGNYSHTEGEKTKSTGVAAHAEGGATIASGNFSHVEGRFTRAQGLCAHAEGYSVEGQEDSFGAMGPISHVEGYANIAGGNSAHAEGRLNLASGFASHAEGIETIAIGEASHAEGWGTKTYNKGEHASGTHNISTESPDDAEATLYTIGMGWHSGLPKNAVEVKKNGDVFIIGIGGYDGTNASSAQSIQEFISSLS